MPMLQLVTFHAHDMRLGVDIQSVLKVLPPATISRVPAAPGFLEGVIHWQERVVPVISARRRLGLPDAPATEQTRIVLISVGTDVMGLLVDRTGAIAKADLRELQPPPRTVAAAFANFFRGVVRSGGDLIMVIDANHVLSLEEVSEVRRSVQG